MCALTAATAAAAADDGAISLRRVQREPVVTQPELQLPEAPTIKWDNAAPDAARLLLLDLRSGRQPVNNAAANVPPAVPAVPSQSALRSATAPAATVSAAEQGMRLNNILLTSGADEAGTITIPNLLPQSDVSPPGVPHSMLLPTPAAVVVDSPPVMQNSVKRVRTTRRGITKFFDWGNTVTIFNSKRGTSRTRGRLIDFYDPADELPDVDDYDMPILLVAAQEPKAPEDEADDKDEANDDQYVAKEDEADRLLKRKLTDIRPTLSYAWGDKDEDDLPTDFYKQMDNGEYMVSIAPRTVLQWEPTNLWYYPLYFEDPGLERYGHTRRDWVQPFVSTGRFFGQVATLPYQMALHPPKCPEYALGYYQPGEWAPKKRYQVPFNEEATATQFLWMAGLILLIP